MCAIDDGVAAYNRKIEDQDVNSVDNDVARRCFDLVVAEIERDQKELRKGKAKRGRPQTWAASYLNMSAKKLAFLTLRSLLTDDCDHKLARTAASIASSVQTEHELMEIKRLNLLRSKKEKGFRRNIHAKFDDAKKIKDLFKHLYGRPLRWQYTHKVGLGARLIKNVVDATGLWSVEMRWEDRKSVLYIEPTPELSNYQDSRHKSLEVLFPYNTVMHCPPLDWGIEGDKIFGGYRILASSFVREKHKVVLANHAEFDLESTFKAVNSIQAVEWCIDTDILKLAESIIRAETPDFHNAMAYAGPRPIFDQFPDKATKEERKVWHHNKEVTLSTWKANRSRAIANFTAVRIAASASNKPVFFPHNLDFRGRIYPIPTRLSPQGGDLQKALLRFAEKKPLGKTGFRRLMIAAAGHAGQDKIPFEDRIKWVVDNYNPNNWDPHSDRRWVDYDSPFCFVQVMNEMYTAVASGNVETFMSNVPCSVDGSQNGLQHLSAICRDQIGGASVNLVDAPLPADLYADVANLVFNSVSGDYEALMESGVTLDEIGQPLPPIVWMDILKHPRKRRAAVKRSVLAYPYGVTKAGMSAGLMADGVTNGLGGSRHKNAWYLAEHIDVAVRGVVISAAQLMDWFRDSVVASIKEDKSICWITPTGFPVGMDYRILDHKAVSTCLGKLTVQLPPDQVELDNKAMVRSIVANFIHSLDASHLMGTCLQCIDEGITNLHFIHDSYGTHACDVDNLNRILREQFVAMHRTKPILAFAEGLGLPVDNLPPKGTLNLDSVLTSRFFFA